MGTRTESIHSFPGEISPEKNCHLLIDAYERLNTEVQLVLAGGASASDAYARSLRQHESDKIRFFDYVSGTQFDELLTNAMLFVLPSDLEGLSLALLEAMGAGLCVLASDIPENRELVDGAGLLFRPGNVADLERMLRVLVSDSSARAWAGKRAKHRIQQQYLWPDNNGPGRSRLPRRIGMEEGCSRRFRISTECAAGAQASEIGGSRRLPDWHPASRLDLTLHTMLRLD